MKRNRGISGQKIVALPSVSGGIFELHETYSHARISEWPKAVHVVSVTPSTYTPNEGSSFTVNVMLSGATTGQTLYYSILGVSGTVNGSDFSDGSLTGSFTASSETAGSFTKTCVPGDGAEVGESFVIEIRIGSSSGPILATSSAITPVDNAESSLYGFTSFTFTNANLSGRIGPTLAQCLASYNTATYTWLSNSAYFTVDASNPGYQLWTVPVSGTYRFVVTGASRGSGFFKGSSSVVTADLYLAGGQKLWIICGQHSTYTESGDGGSFVVSSNNGTIVGSTALLVAGGAGDYSFYGSEGYTAVGYGFANAQTTEGIDVNVLAAWAGSAYTPVTPTPGNGGTISPSTGNGSGGGGFFTDGSQYPTGNFGQGQSFFNGLRGGMYQLTSYNTTTTAGAGFGGGGARNGGYGTGGGGGYTGGVFVGSAGALSPFPSYSRRSTGGSSYAVAGATNVTKALASAGAPSATAVQGSVVVSRL